METAIYFGYPDIAKLLVENGAKLDIFTASGMGMVDEVRKFPDKSEPQDDASKQLQQNKFAGVFSYRQHKVSDGYYTLGGSWWQR